MAEAEERLLGVLWVPERTGTAPKAGLWFPSAGRPYPGTPVVRL